MCRAYDENNNCSTSICKRQYVDNSTWPNGYTFQYQVEGVLPGSDQRTMEAAFERAWSKWARICPFKFQKANGNANLVISVVSANDDFFRRNPQTQAYANIGPSGRQSYVRFRINGLGRWTFEAIHTLFLHEFGHVLGLSHANDRNSIMAPFINNMMSERELTNDDISRMQTLLRSQGLSSPTNNYNSPQQNPQRNPQQTPQNNYNNGQYYYQNPYQNQNQQYYNNYNQNYQTQYQYPQYNYNYNNYAYTYNNQGQNYNYQYYKRSVAQGGALSGDVQVSEKKWRRYRNIDTKPM